VRYLRHYEQLLARGFSKGAALSETIGRLVLSLVLAAGLAAGSRASSETPPYFGERLEYTASYEGIFSGGHPVDIADVVLSSNEQAIRFEGESAYTMSFSASSEPYPDVDALLRVRYSFRSLVSEDLRRSLMFEQTAQGRDPMHKVVWLDWKGRRVARLSKDEGSDKTASPGNPQSSEASGAETALSPSQLQQLGIHDDRSSYETRLAEDVSLPDPLLDRLSFIYRLRSQDLRDGGVLQVPVTDGDKLLEYKVRVLGSETIEAAGRSWPTRHLRIAAFKRNGARSKPDHEPIDVWLALDPFRTPVRFAGERSFGRFDVRLRTASQVIASPCVAGSARVVRAPP